MGTSKAAGFCFGLANFKGTSKIGLSSNIDDVSKTVLVDVLDGGSDSIVVVGVVWVFDTTASEAIL